MRRAIHQQLFIVPLWRLIGDQLAALIEHHVDEEGYISDQSMRMQELCIHRDPTFTVLKQCFPAFLNAAAKAWQRDVGRIFEYNFILICNTVLQLQPNGMIQKVDFDFLMVFFFQ